MTDKAKGWTSKWIRAGIFSALLLLVCFFTLGIFKNLSGPTYQDHNMEWWLDYANTQDGRSYWYARPVQPSPVKKESIEAFRAFGDPGVAFLCEEAYKSSTTNALVSVVQKALKWTPWYKRRDFREERINISGTAGYLLSDMGISYKQAEKLAHPKLQSPNPNTRDSVTWIYHLVTNRLDVIAEKTAPFLTHTNSSSRFWAIRTMEKLSPENARVCYPGLADPIHLVTRQTEYFHILAKFAADSPEIKKRLLELTGSPEPRVAIQVHLALVHGYPEESSHRERLIELVRADIESNHTSCLGILRNWPHPISLLHPILIELVQSSQKPDEYLQIIELLRQRDADLSPFIPKLHLLLTFSPFENEYGFFSVRNRDITAMALLLEHNLDDEKVWAYLEDLFGQMLPPFAEKRDKQSRGMINMANDRARFLQRMAQHHAPAAQLIEKLPLAKVRFGRRSFSWIDTLLRRHHLIPLESMDETP